MNNQLFWFDNVEVRPNPWPGLNWITPILQFPDVKKARDLYINAFNFVSIFDLPNPKNGDELVTTRLRYRGTNFLLTKEGLDYPGESPETSQSAPPFNFYVYVDNVDVTYKKALELGMTSIREAAETPWGDYRARLRCPFGYIWDIAQRIR
jgi:PhnB protein